MKKWRVAVLGLGHWYSAYNLARALREYPNAELVAAAWHDSRQLGEFTATFGVRGYASCDDLLEREPAEIVHIAAPVREIPELTIRSARAGKHIILGKPIAMTLAQANSMVDAVEQAGVACLPLQGIMRLRFADLKSRLDRGDIGQLVLWHHTARWSIAENWYRSGTPGWFADPNQVPGGAFIDEGIYWIDLFRWMTGSEVVQVEAKIANLVHKDIAVEDWGMATFTAANGVIGTLEASWTITAPQATGPSPKQNSVVRLELVGTRGEIISQWSTPDGFVPPGRAVLAAGAGNWVYEHQSEEPFRPASPFPLDHLIDCLERGWQPTPTIQDARKSLSVALAAYQSAREGQPVRFS